MTESGVPAPAEPLPAAAPENRTCKYPGCDRPRVAVTDGRPREYCADPSHTRQAAWRKRKELEAEKQATADAEAAFGRPVTMATTRAQMLIERLEETLNPAVELASGVLRELKVLEDAEKVELEIKTIRTSAAEEVAAINSELARAQDDARNWRQALEQAEQQRQEADDVAEEATAELATTRLTLTTTQTALSEVTDERDRLAAELDDARATTAAHQAQIDALTTELAATRAAGTLAAENLDKALQRAAGLDARIEQMRDEATALRDEHKSQLGERDHEIIRLRAELVTAQTLAEAAAETTEQLNTERAAATEARAALAQAQARAAQSEGLVTGLREALTALQANR